MEKLIWVELETTKATDDTWLLKGQVLQAVFDAIVTNQLTSGYFKLDKVYWISSVYDEITDTRKRKLFEYGACGRHQDYRGDIYLKVEHIASISPIDGEAELARFRQPDKKHLSVVSPIRP